MTATPQYRKNPYIIGRPISEPKLFFGRESLFDFINDNLNQGTKVILLHGQRRIGKSSVLSQIPNFVGKDKFVFVSFDLHDQGQSPLPQILHNLAKDISKQLRLSADTFKVPRTEDLAIETTTLFRNFLAKVYQELGHKSLVFLLDEFDVLSNSEHHQGFDNFFRYLQSILEQEDKLFVIPVVGQSLKDLQNLPLFYKRAPQQKISLLNESNAKKLITEPAQGVLDYQLDAIQAIWELSAGHPYCIQVICHAVFAKARERDSENWTITRTDVEKIVNKAIEIGEGGLIWFWDGLSIRERIVFSAVAEVQTSQQPEKYSTVYVNAEQCWEYLKNLGVVLTESLHKAESQLVKENFLQREYLSQKSGKKTAGLKVTIEIVRRWIVKQHPLHREVRELEMLDSEANRIYKTSAELRQQGADIHKQINHYERVLELNPNHFSALSDLAQGYLVIPDFANAIRVYERVYKVDPIRTKDQYLRSLLSYGSQLMEQREFRQAVIYYSLANDVDLNNQTVQKKLVEALDSYGSELMEPQCKLARWQFERILQLEPDNNFAKKQLLKCDKVNSKGNPLVLGSIAALIVTVIFSFGWLVRGEQELTNTVYTPNNSSEPGNTDHDNCPINSTGSIDKVELCISYGEKLLVSSNISEEFKQGMKSFRESKLIVKSIQEDQTDDLSEGNEDKINQQIQSAQDEYTKASESFEKAAQLSKTENESEYSNPEALIYSNNARARAQEGSPLTLAVVVPGDDELLARAILRGVAQAQDEFNDEGGLNGQLLQIAIANDGNDPERAKKVAEALVKNHKSVLGVIGHSSNITSLAALSEYSEANSELAIISPTSSSIWLTDKNFFRTVPSDTEFGKQLAELVNNELTTQNLDKNVIIVYSADTFDSIYLKEAFEKQFESEKIGVSVVKTISFSDPNLNSEVFLEEAEAAILLPNQASIDQAIEIAQLNADPQRKKRLALFGGDTLLDNKVLSQGKEAVEDLLLALPWFDESSTSKEFVTTVNQDWGKEKVSWRTATSYDATQAFIKALSSNTSREEVLEKLREIKLEANETSGGTLEFNANGERQCVPESESQPGKLYEPTIIVVKGESESAESVESESAELVESESAEPNDAKFTFKVKKQGGC